MEGGTMADTLGVIYCCVISESITQSTLLKVLHASSQCKQPNILGLLHVPEHFIRHRHFQNQYEGGSIGEGIVKDLRKLCPNAVRNAWSRNMMKNFYRNQ
jgi:hypothetical protein